MDYVGEVILTCLVMIGFIAAIVKFCQFVIGPPVEGWGGKVDHDALHEAYMQEDLELRLEAQRRRLRIIREEGEAIRVYKLRAKADARQRATRGVRVYPARAM